MPHCFKLSLVAALALAIVGCGGGATSVRPYVKRGGAETSADPAPAAETDVKKTEKLDAKTNAENNK